MDILSSFPTEANKKVLLFVRPRRIVDAEILSFVDQSRCGTNPETEFVTIGKNSVGVSLCW